MNADAGQRFVRNDRPTGATVERRRRRWDDEPPQLAALTLARYLAGRPDLDDVARFLVGLCWPIGAQGAVILAESPNDGLEVLAEYVEQVADWAPAGAPHPLRSAVFEIAGATAGERVVLWTGPESPAGRPIAAWPMGVPSGPIGALVIFLSRPMEPAVVESRIDGVVDVLAVYLAGARSPIARDVEFTPSCPRPLPDSVELTARQVEILRLMSRGLTNRQIAGRIGFSDSTVRAESLAVYRALGVRDRQQAVIVGGALGLITPSAPESGSDDVHDMESPDDAADEG